MRTSRDVGLPLIKAFEGCLKPVPGRPGYFGPYYCPAGVLTQGWGHTNLGNIAPPVVEGKAWSQMECDQALANDMVKFEGRVFKILAGMPLVQNEVDALVSFDFNTGGLDRSSIPAKIRSGRRDQVSETLARWNKANGAVLNGLVRRRKAEGLLFDGKPDEALRVAGAHRDTGETMPQRVERPRPPADEITKRAKGELGTVAAGGATAGTAAGTAQPSKPDAPKPNNSMAIAATWLGGMILIIGLAALIAKYRKIDADWA